MVKKGGNNGWLLVGLVAFGALIYFKTGWGKTNSPLIPDRIEDAVDAVVNALNERFGQQWVNAGMEALQSYIDKAMPQVAALANLVVWAEQQYERIPNSGSTKKYVTLQRARRLA